MLKPCKAEKEIPNQYYNFKNCLNCPFAEHWDEYDDCCTSALELLEILFYNLD